jgi:tetratricopeptide (TPR) repeat protein
MLYNALKNSAEIYERKGDFKMAKKHYTQALKQSLKINEKGKEQFIWTRLGFIEYDIFKDLHLARQCFEAAIQNSTAFEKRSAKITPMLVKLSEIYF